MLALPAPRRSFPAGLDGEDAGERIEAALVADHRPVVGLPPVAREKARDDAVAAPAVPHQCSARREHAGKLGDDARVIGGIGEEAEGGEQVHHRVEPAGPARRQLAHVTARVAQCGPGAALPCLPDQMRRVVQTVDVEAGFGEQMRVASLTAGYVQHPRPGWEREDLHQTRDLASVADEIEDRFVLEQVVRVEVRGPPLLRLACGRQKNTGSRYAPNTSSRARRISNSVQ